MSFTVTVGLATEHDRTAFLERAAPRLHAHATAEPSEEDGLFRVSLTVTAPSAAREICHQCVAFLAHAKNTRIDLYWKGANGEEASGEIRAGDQKSAEIVAVRVVQAARAALETTRS